MEFNRPDLDYVADDRKNSKRFENITNSAQNNLIPVQVQELELNHIQDQIAYVYQQVLDIDAGVIPGSSDPENANKLLTTDGAGNLSFVDVTSSNIQDRSISAVKFQTGTITNTELGEGCVLSNNIPEGELGYGKLTINPKEIPVSCVNITDQSLNYSWLRLPLGGIPWADLNVPAGSITDSKIGSVSPSKLSSPVPVPKGGTGTASFNVNRLICSASTGSADPLKTIINGDPGTILMSSGTGNLPSFVNPIAKPADQANLSNNTYVTPANQYLNVSAIKAFAVFSNTTILNYFNISSIDNPENGFYIINFSNNFSNKNYGINLTVEYVNNISGYIVTEKTVSYVKIRTFFYDSSQIPQAFVNGNATRVNISFYV